LQERGKILQSEFQLLVRECLAGRQTAMRDLVGRFQSRVYGLCLRMLGHHQDAEDATQETFVRVLRNLHRWDPDREFEPWLLTIAGNRCRSRLTQRAKRPSIPLLDYPISDATRQEQSRTQLAEELELALTDLRDDYRECFEMFHQKGMAYNEIAERLDIPLGTVKTWVHRARREIVDRLRTRGVLLHGSN
jgi:RNA polymerase sigma-70 factor (ECF subfamily)